MSADREQADYQVIVRESYTQEIYVKNVKKNETETKQETKQDIKQGIKDQTYNSIEEINTIVHITGDRISIAQQTALLVMALCFALSGILCLFFKELFFLAYVLDYIPLLGEISLFTFFLSLCCVTCFPSKFAKKPMNLLLFLVHSCSRIISCLYLCIWLFVGQDREQSRSMRQISLKSVELSYLLIVIMIFWILFELKNNNVATMNIKSNFMRIVIVASVFSLLLILLSGASLFDFILLPTVGIAYLFVLILAIQRVGQHEFILQSNNHIYMGCAFLDSQMLFGIVFCKCD